MKTAPRCGKSAPCVLRRMLEDGYITQLAHDEAVAELDQVEFDQAQCRLMHRTLFSMSKICYPKCMARMWLKPAVSG